MHPHQFLLLSQHALPGGTTIPGFQVGAVIKTVDGRNEDDGHTSSRPAGLWQGKKWLGGADNLQWLIIPLALFIASGIQDRAVAWTLPPTAGSKNAARAAPHWGPAVPARLP